MYSYGSPHTAAQKQDDQHERTFSFIYRLLLFHNVGGISPPFLSISIVDPKTLKMAYGNLTIDKNEFDLLCSI